MRPLNLQQQRGQAMTEFTITAMFLLVPLFLLIPIIGKYIDIRHSTVQTARTMAWERTVWFEQANWPRDAGTPQFKSEKEIERVATMRNLAATDKAFQLADWRTDIADNEINRHWRDHGDNPLLSASSSLGGIDQQDQNPTSNVAYSYFILDGIQKVEDGINNVINKGWSAINGAASIIGISLPGVGQVDIFSKFNNQAYYTPEARIPVNNIPNLARFAGSVSPFANINLVMQGDAALITNGWTARNSNQFAEWTGDFVPTHILKPVFDPLQGALNSIGVAGIKVAPRTAPGILRFGEVDTGSVPPSNVEPQCPGGLCSYE